jgi:hypothetical protein
MAPPGGFNRPQHDPLDSYGANIWPHPDQALLVAAALSLDSVGDLGVWPSVAMSVGLSCGDM